MYICVHTYVYVRGSGVCLGCAWGVPGVCLGCAWAVPGVHGACLGCAWLLRGSAWTMPGVCLGCGWRAWDEPGYTHQRHVKHTPSTPQASAKHTPVTPSTPQARPGTPQAHPRHTPSTPQAHPKYAQAHPRHTQAYARDRTNLRPQLTSGKFRNTGEPLKEELHKKNWPELLDDHYLSCPFLLRLAEAAEEPALERVALYRAISSTVQDGVARQLERRA